MRLAFIIDSAITTTVVVGSGGCVFYFFKGAWRCSSEGEGGNEIAAGAKEVIANETRILRCAAWSGVMTVIDLGLQHARNGDDPLNMTLAWGAANALFSVHRGPRAAVREGLKGAAVGGAVGLTLFTLLKLVCCD